MEESSHESPDVSPGSVYKKFGRCILLLQQYEMLLKALVANQEISGTLDDVEQRRRARKENVSRKTLGQLIGEFTGTYLTPLEDKSSDQKDDLSELSSEKPFVRTRFTVEMMEEYHQRAREGLEKLVILRNELVHHFLARFDLRKESGWNDVDRYLNEADRLIEEQLSALRSLAKSFESSRDVLVDILNSESFAHWVTHGQFPPRAIDWPYTSIVSSFVAAELQYQEDGWTELSKAIEFIRSENPEVTPRRYGCSSRRGVIHESRLFDIEKRTDADSGRNRIWYRRKMSTD